MHFQGGRRWRPNNFSGKFQGFLLKAYYPISEKCDKRYLRNNLTIDENDRLNVKNAKCRIFLAQKGEGHD